MDSKIKAHATFNQTVRGKMKEAQRKKAIHTSLNMYYRGVPEPLQAHEKMMEKERRRFHKSLMAEKSRKTQVRQFNPLPKNAIKTVDEVK